RAILGLPIPGVTLRGPAASAVILADREATDFVFTGVAEALSAGRPDQAVDLRLFGKPTPRPDRRMGVALALGRDTDEARATAKLAADRVGI
ncbi:phosphoribosylglycinamide formyltransferase 2, partial [Acinetobacter baumannii]